MYRYFKKIANTERNSSWKSKGLSDEIIKPPTISDNSLAPDYIGNKKIVKFDGGCLKQDRITFTHGTIVNIYIVYEISFSDSNNHYLALENSLFGAMKLTKMLILISINILDMVLDLIDVERFHFLLVDLVAI